MEYRRFPRGGVWLLAGLLAILLLLSLALLGDLLGLLVIPGQTIALTPEDTGSLLTHTLYRPLAAQSEMQTQDALVQWESDTDIDLFRDSYTNDLGQLTVRSLNGDKVIAPGTSNYYRFSIRNTGNTVLEYTIRLTNAFDLTGLSIPLRFRLRRGGEWLVGSDSQWHSLEDINRYQGTSVLNPERIDEYLLEWLWPFEAQDDTLDTRIGRVNINADADFHMTITTTAQAPADAPAVNAMGQRLYQKASPVLPALLLALDGLVLAGLLLLLWRRKITVLFRLPQGAQALLLDGSSLTPDDQGQVRCRLASGEHRFCLLGAEGTLTLKPTLRRREVAKERIQYPFYIRCLTLWLTPGGPDTTQWSME